MSERQRAAGQMIRIGTSDLERFPVRLGSGRIFKELPIFADFLPRASTHLITLADFGARLFLELTADHRCLWTQRGTERAQIHFRCAFWLHEAAETFTFA
jgi:hypothetical protein